MTADAETTSAWLETGAWLETIEDAVSRSGASMVLPADGKASELVAALQDRLSVPAFPMLPLKKFQTLNNKWAFYQLCRQLDLPTPATWRFQDKSSLLAAIGGGELPESLIAKPLCGAGGIGVVPFTARNAAHELEQVDYEPILVQEYIDGEHIGLSVFTSKGSIVAATVHQIRGQRFFFKPNEEYLGYGRTIAATMETEGAMNFDAQMSRDGRIYLLECNPRVFLTMDYVAIAGINFVAMGLRDWNGRRPLTVPAPEIAVPEVAIRSPMGFLGALLKPWRVEPADLRMARFALADPIPLLIETSRLVWLRLSTPSGVRRM